LKCIFTDIPSKIQLGLYKMMGQNCYNYPVRTVLMVTV